MTNPLFDTLKFDSLWTFRSESTFRERAKHFIQSEIERNLRDFAEKIRPSESERTARNPTVFGYDQLIKMVDRKVNAALKDLGA